MKTSRRLVVIWCLCHQEPVAVRHVDNASTAVSSHHISVRIEINTCLYLQLLPYTTSKITLRRCVPLKGTYIRPREGKL
jgi:hypothetical protein